MSDHTKMMKRLLLPALISSALAIPAQANTIRIMGPSDEQAAPSPYTPSSVQQPYASENRYGPTTHQETLWSIASRYRPNDQISIYQVIGAIFRNNPQAFEQNNIHGLVPGSILTIPTLSQIQRENVDAVKQRLEADKGQIARVAANKPKPVLAKAPAPTVVKAEAAPAAKAAPKAAPKAEPKPASRPVQATVQESDAKVVQKTAQKAAQSTVSADDTARSLIPQKPKALQDQLDASDEQMTKLLESNHLLRVRLAEMQHEVAALKNQISDDEQLREQIKGFIEQQKALQQAKPTEPELTTFDRIIDNPLALAAMALIPGGLLAALAAFLLWGRKKEEEEPLDALEAPHDDETAMVPSPVDNEVVPNLALGDDDDLDDLFSDDDPLFANDTDDKSDLDDELFEMESGFGPSSISVKGDEEAIGLEDMERALDEIEQKADLSSDEALAAMWEKSLQVEDDEDGFDLSFDSDALDLDRPDAFSPDLADDLPKETAARRPEVEPDQENLISQDDLDSLFDSFVADDMDDTFDKPAAFDNSAAAADSDALKREEDDRAQQAAIDQALAEAEDMFSLSSQVDIDDLFSANSTSLLDELMDEEEDDALTSDITLEEDSTALLDELLGDLEDDDFPSTSIALEENSTELLDELMADLDEDDDDASTLDWPEMDDPEFESPSAPVNTDFARDLRDAYQQGEQPDVASDVNAEAKPETKPESQFDSQQSEGKAPENAAQAYISLAAPVAAAATAIAVDEVLADELFTQVTERDLTVSDSVEATPSLNQSEPDIASEPDVESAPAPVQEPEPEPELEPEGAFDVDTSAFTVESESQHDDAFVSDEDMSVPESTFAPESEPALAQEPAVAEGYVFEDPVVEDLVAEAVAEPVVEQAVEPVSVDADADADADADVEQESELAEMPAQPEVAEKTDIEPDVLPQTEASEPVPATPYGSDDEQAELEALLAASFTEEDAAAMDPSVGMTVEQLLESLDVNAPLDLSDYPEFDEEAAMNAPDAELDDTPQMDVSPDEEQAVFDNIVRQLQQAAEAAERPQTAASANAPVEEMADAAVQEADAPDVSVSDVPFADDNAEVPESTLDLGLDDEAEPSAFGLHGQPQVAFETYDAASLPEFGEDDALQASFDEQHELEQYELEQGLGQAQSSALEAAANTVTDNAAAPVADSAAYTPSSPAAPLSPEAEAVRDSMETAGLDMAALLSEPEVEPSRADAFEQVEAMDETSAVDHAAELAPQSVSVSDAAVDELEREALFSPATSAAETIDASQMEDEAMSAEDDAIWSAANVEPELEGEDWTSQPEMHTEDVPAFDQDDAALDAVTASVTAPESVLDEVDYAAQMPAPEAVAPVEHAVQDDTSWQDDSESVLLTEEKPAPAPTPSYISIEELMRELDDVPATDMDEAPLNLEVGLDEFPDVLAGIDSYDVDSQGEYASKLDLAKAYLEMNDSEGARDLLEEIALQADSDLQSEAKALLGKMKV